MSSLRFILALLVFALITGIIPFPAAHRWDQAVTVWLQHAAPTPDIPAATVVLLGNAEVVIPGIALAGIFLFRRDPSRGMASLWLAAGLVGVGLLAVILKHVIVHPGPPPSLQRHVFRGIALPQTPFSYPSGHTIRTTILAGMLLRDVPMLASALVLGMMAALVYLGDHWMSDVVGGLCLGWACTEVARSLRKQLI